LASAYRDGKTLPKNDAKSKKHLDRLFAQPPEAALSGGLMLLGGGPLWNDPDTGQLILARLGDDGSTPAQLALAGFLEQRAARSRDARSEARRDKAQALAWYLKAAEAGYGPAQLQAGRMYAGTQGVRMQPLKMRQWMQAAMKKGIKRAARDYAEHLKDMRSRATLLVDMTNPIDVRIKTHCEDLFDVEIDQARLREENQNYRPWAECRARGTAALAELDRIKD
jgi:TPR repeat protein